MITIWLRTCSLDQDANSLAMVEAAARITMQSQGTMTAAHFVKDVDEEGENRVHQYFRSLYLQVLEEMGTGCHDTPSDMIQPTYNPNDDPDDDPTAPATVSAAAHTPISHAESAELPRSFVEVLQPSQFAVQHALKLSTQAAEKQEPLERVAREQAATSQQISAQLLAERQQCAG